MLEIMDKVCQQMSRLVSIIYMSIVIALICGASMIYFVHVYPVMWMSLPIHLAKIHTTIAMYLLFGVVSNYTICLFKSAGRPPPQTDTEFAAIQSEINRDNLPEYRTRSETWRYCEICRCTKPPRCHHCSSCNSCYYKLCHHCPALGKCIGRDNYPYYFRFIICSWWGSLFLGLSCSYIQKQTFSNLIFGTNVACSSVGVAVGVLGAWHLYLLLSAQTTIEWLENMQMRRLGIKRAEEWGWYGGPFHKGIVANLKESFGDPGWKWIPWWMVLFLPIDRIEYQQM